MERKRAKKVMMLLFAIAMVLSMFTMAVSNVCANDTDGNMAVDLTPPLDDTYVSANPNDN